MSVDQKPDPLSVYWNDRFTRYNHTGWNIPGIYKYDQKVRVRAVLSSLDALNIPCTAGSRVLDIGCGTGAITEALARRGATVVGYDISSGVIEQARARLGDAPNVVLECANLVDTELKHGPYDLITSVTVLQHQVDDRSLSEVIGKLSRALKRGGTVLILESVLPEGSSGRGADHYIRPRTRSEWLERFREAGLQLVYERSYPQAALTTLGWIRSAVRRAKRKARNARSSVATVQSARPDGRGTADRHPGFGSRVRSRVRLAGVKCFLAVFVPIDHWLRIPTPKAVASGRILAFKAATRPVAEL